MIDENAYLKKYSTNKKELKTLGFRATVVLVSIFVLCYRRIKIIMKIILTYFLLYIWSKILNSSKYAMCKAVQDDISGNTVPHVIASHCRVVNGMMIFYAEYNVINGIRTASVGSRKMPNYSGRHYTEKWSNRIASNSSLQC